MASFRDKEKREWIVAVTVLEARYLRDHHNPPIKLTDADCLSKLFEDECNLYEVMWSVCREQAKKYDVDELGFAKLFTENFVEATEALAKALKDFFQSIARIELSALIEKTLNASKKLRENAAKNLSSDLMTEAVDAVIATENQATIDRLTAMKTSGKVSGD
jgi:hypothetical protein